MLSNKQLKQYAEWQDDCLDGLQADAHDMACELRDARAELERLRWKPITADSLPVVGDEVLAYEQTWRVYSIGFMSGNKQDVAAWWERNGWTHHRPHHRPINPPQEPRP